MELSSPPGAIPDGVRPEDFAVFAGRPSRGESTNLVKAFQKSGHTVGMCGDGANDAPALRQAQMGIAGVDRDRCCQVGGRHRAHQARTSAGIVASVMRGPRDGSSAS